MVGLKIKEAVSNNGGVPENVASLLKYQLTNQSIIYRGIKLKLDMSEGSFMNFELVNELKKVESRIKILCKKLGVDSAEHMKKLEGNGPLF